MLRTNEYNAEIDKDIFFRYDSGLKYFLTGFSQDVFSAPEYDLRAIAHIKSIYSVAEIDRKTAIDKAVKKLRVYRSTEKHMIAVNYIFGGEK